ncbi:MucB/RseB C-terminal domain-containing protein [Halomonas sp. 328]|uniref:MucB/RseB C-terminal domain-containing protein n=1 Tax=Halomonas sp. 328 TaxID=2776704 RepID=UPI001E5948BF|nr:MucB/RseB C-terminal domain-containing protein [Halomonas sp. 328]
MQAWPWKRLGQGMLLGLSLGWGSLAQADEPGFDCRVLDATPVPDTPAAWFERSLWANHCYLFEARAVRISGEGVRALALSHQVEDGLQREVAHYLDGPPQTYERLGRIGRGGWAEPGSEVPASPDAIMAHLDNFYRLRLAGDERVAGRDAQRLDIEPLDAMRYGQRLWLDRDTGLPLKQELLDVEGRVLETFQLTELERPRLYDGRVRLDALREAPPETWRPGWLPPGYVAQPVVTTSSLHGERVGHRVYSDGLSSLSLFVEPLTDEHPRLAPGLHRLGISYAAVHHRELGGRPMQIVALGEVPPRVLLQVVERLRWQSEEP